MKRFLTCALALSLLAGTVSIASAAGNQNPGSYQNTDNRDGNSNAGHKDWRRGQRIEQADWNRGQRVNYRQRHLHRPARGYEWREVDGHYVEAAIVGGLIASVIVARSH
jgi:Ni/Co efflux regulator RcnB